MKQSFEITFPCPRCRTWNEAHGHEIQDHLKCRHCFFLIPINPMAWNLESCPVCKNMHLYQQKDFNRKLGIFLVVLGVLGAYFTYGLSLLGIVLFDCWLFKKVNNVGICYRCLAQFRYLKAIERLPVFDLKLHDYYQNLRNKKSLTYD